ncbi:MAG: heme biosynthesis protein HemY [Pseudohongiellaceae bacterium]
MIKLFIFSLLAILLAVALSLFSGFPADPGYLMVAFGNTTFETSLFALMVAIAFITLLVRVLYLLLYALNPFKIVEAGKNYQVKRKSRKRTKTVEGLLAFSRGDWLSAYGLLIRGAKQSDSNVANYLAAAYAAYELDDREAWNKALDEAEAEYPTMRSTIHFVKAQLLFRSNQLEQCLAILEQIKSSGTKEVGVFKLLKEVYVSLEEWQKLQDLIPVLEKKKIIDTQEAERIGKRVCVEQLYEIASSSEDGQSTEGISSSALSNSLAKTWKRIPAKFRDDPKLVKHYCELLVKLDDSAGAVKAMEVALSKNWSDELVIQYGQRDYGANQAQLLIAENWLKARPANSELLLSLGRICMRNQLWGKAKEYYQASISIAPSADAYGELAKLLKNLGEQKESEENFRHFSSLVNASLIELPQPDLKTS